MLSATMIFHCSVFDLKQYVGGHLAPAQAAVIQAHMEDCEECQLRLADIALETQWKDEERRSDPRVPVDYPARLKLLDPVTSVGPPHEARVVEISRNGLRIRTTRFLIPKSLVQIRFNGKAMLAEVRYCIKAGPEYHAGLCLTEDFPST
jgi:anti-sigma factor RsiW